MRIQPRNHFTPRWCLISRRREASSGEVAARNGRLRRRRIGSFGIVPRRGGADRTSPPPPQERAAQWRSAMTILGLHMPDLVAANFLSPS